MSYICAATNTARFDSILVRGVGNAMAGLSVFVAMSVLQALWEPAATAIPKQKASRKKAEMEHSILKDRDRSPRRCNGAKARLKSWAKGDISTVSMWRLCYAIVEKDNTDAGAGMARLAGLATAESDGREKNCPKQMKALLAATALPSMIRTIPDVGVDDTVTHTLHTDDVNR